MMIEKHT